MHNRNETDPITLAERLTIGARSPEVRAALALLLSLTGLFARADVVQRWYDSRSFGHPPFVRWDVVVADADGGHVPMSTGERAVVHLAASIATRHPIVLSDVLPHLDDGHAAGLVVALHTLVVRPTASAQDYARFAGQDERV